MAPQTTLTGTLVACYERPYKSFTTREGEQRPGGVTRWALVGEFGKEPQLVKLADPAHLATLHAAGLGADVVVECVLFANNNTIQHQAVDVEVTPTSKRRAPLTAAG
jgi:hypothetical protein